MRNRRSIFILLLGVVFLAFVHFAIRSYEDGRISEKRRTLFDREESISTLRIERRGSAALEIRKGEDGRWRIVEPFSGRADEQTVARLLDVISLTPISDVISDGELLRLGRTRADFALVESPVKISLGTATGTNVISLGVLTPSADGVYAAVDDLGVIFVVPTEILSSVDRPTEDFRRRTLFTAAPESIASFVLRQGQGATMSFVRENDGWKVDGELASKTQVERFLADLLSAEVLDFVWPVGASNETEHVSAALLAGYGLEPENAVTVTLKGADEKDRQLSFGRAASSGRVYASVQNGNAVVTVKEDLKSAALQTKTVFADYRLFPVSESSVGFLRIVDGSQSYVLARSADRGVWRVETPVAAPAELAFVRRILSRILALPASVAKDAPRNFSVALSADVEPICIPRDLVLEKDRIDDIRSVEMVRINPKEVKRLVCTPGEKGAPPLSVVRGREDGSWSLESSDDQSSIKIKGIAKVLEALNPLVATRVEKLKVSAADLDGYGLGVPFLTVAVDLDRENAVRRNILIGAKTSGGRYATIGSADAVFVISNETFNRLSEMLVGR